MSLRLSERQIPSALRALGDEIAARLPEPYDLIAEWTNYVPLDVLLYVRVAALSMRLNPVDGMVTMLWDDLPGSDKDYIVPEDLRRRTLAYEKRTQDLRSCMSYFDETIFFNENGIVREVDFLNAVSETIRSSEP